MSNNISTLVACQNKSEAAVISSFFINAGCAVTETFDTTSIGHNKFDLVIMDTDILPFFEPGSEIFNGFVVVYCVNGKIPERIYDYEISYYFSQFPSNELLGYVLDKVQSTKPTFDIIHIVTQLLYTMGLSSNLKGFLYIRDAILMVLEDRDYINYVTKRLYPDIAKRYSTTLSAVERAIRHAVYKAFEFGTPDFMRSMGYSRERCTNAEFIALVSDYVFMNHSAKR